MDVEQTSEKGRAFAAAAEGAIEGDLRRDRARRWLRALGSGVIGAAALSGAHEALRFNKWSAPRMNRVGERSLARLVRRAGKRPPRGAALYTAALASDLGLNGLTYGLALAGEPVRAWLRGLFSGAFMGVASVFLPALFGVKRPRQLRSWDGQAMAIGLYALGGLCAAACYSAMARVPREAEA
jgi:hypothetical protein